MKRLYFLSVVLICLIFAFIGCSNIESSNIFESDKHKIDNRLLYNQINNLVNKKYLEEVFVDDFNTQYESVVLPENYEEIENSIIEDMAIIECCKEKGIIIDEDSAAKYAKLQFEELKADDSQNRYAVILKHTLSEFDLSENEYISLLCEQAFYKYNKQALYKYFSENLYKENSDKTIEEQFDVYIDKLLK